METLEAIATSVEEKITTPIADEDSLRRAEEEAIPLAEEVDGGETQQGEEAQRRTEEQPRWQDEHDTHEGGARDAASGTGSSRGGRDAHHLRELRICLRAVLADIRKEKRYSIFARPVDPEQSPGYYQVILEPMDLDTMRARIDAGEYLCASDFIADTRLIKENARKYPPGGVGLTSAANPQRASDALHHASSLCDTAESTLFRLNNRLGYNLLRRCDEIRRRTDERRGATCDVTQEEDKTPTCDVTPDEESEGLPPVKAPDSTCDVRDEEPKENASGGSEAIDEDMGEEKEGAEETEETEETEEVLMRRRRREELEERGRKMKSDILAKKQAIIEDTKGWSTSQLTGLHEAFWRAVQVYEIDRDGAALLAALTCV
eukprot:CAMPEP_0185757208 /NCGR_PEP_ID=MMETSP1174-20130828/15673_1 /TAXON_ID=35687 /ORGANISM="Dictyocha speculum, Strain CCMP1381" /LENGTH=375 /DNA_ID=CAMNT_0028436521 /DNA_START=16 /DNA_END=1143 /DNA_ORIENTATION=+